MSLITQKFNYSRIARSNTSAGRVYNTPEGKVPSVTTILGATSDKTFLFDWQNRVGKQRAQEITNEASSRGQRMHKFLEKYIETGQWPEPGTNPYSIHANKMAQVIRDRAFCDIDEIWGSEVNLWMPSLYAGTTDLVSVYKGNPCICDYKQSNKAKKVEYIIDYFLQICMYIMAHNELYKTNIREGHIFICTVDLEYQQFDVWPDDFDEWKEEVYKRLYSYYEKEASKE